MQMPIEEVRRRVALRVLAEFLLIVVGVLVAFALDDWGNDRADRVVELQYLGALAADLRRDSTSLTAIHIPNLAAADVALESIGPVARGEKAFPADTVSFLLQVAASHRTPFLLGTGPTYEELVATGSLRLLESADLRSAVVAYYQSKTLAIIRDQSRASGYADLVRAYLPEGGPAGSTLTGNARIEDVARVFGVRRAAEALQSLEFVRALNRHINYLGIMRPTLDGLLQQLEDLIPQVDRELARLG